MCACRQCGRKFNADRIEKHEAACAKSNQTRKKFNMKDKRMTAEQRKAARTAPKPKAKRGGGGKWKREHEVRSPAPEGTWSSYALAV